MALSSASSFRKIVSSSTTVKRLEKSLADHPLTIHNASDLPLVQMDFVLMEQVLVNLLDNIGNYTPPGTPARIESWIEDQHLKIAVSDSGPGIPAESLERIFTKFYRIPGTATGGTGLGLSICRGLVEAHGGTLVVSNKPDGGTRFLISLPAMNTPPPVKEASL